jgi:ArsR family metal-binding transcriptional regulator
MAVKYEVESGDSVFKTQARTQREDTKKILKGMHCSKCSKDTVVRFTKWDSYVKTEIDACCPAFENILKDKMWPNKNG